MVSLSLNTLFRMQLILPLLLMGMGQNKAQNTDNYGGLDDPAIEQKAADLLSQMSTQEKLLQLLSYVPNGVPRLGIPNLEAGEALHGVVSNGATCFPQSIGLGATWDPALMQEIGTMVAKEARAVGVGQAFAPMLGLARDPRWGRVEESYGEDPYLVTQIGVNYIEGLQGTGDHFLDADHIISTPKHLVADGEPWGGENGEDFEISERVLREDFMMPFEAAVKIGHTVSIMPAHHALNGVPCHANGWLLTDVLRQEWGFKGFVTSDMGDIPKLAQGHHYAADMEDAAVKALSAGVDMELIGNLYKNQLLQALNEKKISITVIDTAAKRVLCAKIKLLGLSAPQTAPVPTDTGATKETITNYKGQDDIWAKLVAEGKFNTPENSRRPDYQKILSDPTHDALALKAAQEALVLLKNDNHLLPLDRTKIRKILITGQLAKQVNLGGYSTGKPRFYINMVDGLTAEAGSAITVTYAQGCYLSKPDESLIPAAVTAAQDADVIIAVVGQTRGQAGENLDRDNLDLVGSQEKMVEALQATGKPVVVVLENGAPLSIVWIHDHVPAILDSWYGGQAAGQAVAQALFGKVNPGGKLPFSVPRNVGQIPCYYNHLPLTGPLNFYQSPGGNLFSFGTGLSYTTFTYAEPTISPASISPSEISHVSVRVTNTGSTTGDEVVQLYINQSQTSLLRPVEELRGFQRITLNPGESKTVSFPLGFEELKFWKDTKWVTEPGKITVLFGSSCQDIHQKGTLELTP